MDLLGSSGNGAGLRLRPVPIVDKAVARASVGMAFNIPLRATPCGRDRAAGRPCTFVSVLDVDAHALARLGFLPWDRIRHAAITTRGLDLNQGKSHGEGAR